MVDCAGQPGHTTSQEATIPLTYKQLVRAAADNDYSAERLGDFPSILRDLRMEPDDTIRAAEQRTLRMILILRGESEEVRRMALAGEFSTIELSEDEARLENLFQLAWLDGAATVAKAIHNSRQPKKQH